MKVLNYITKLFGFIYCQRCKRFHKYIKFSEERLYKLSMQRLSERIEQDVLKTIWKDVFIDNIIDEDSGISKDMFDKLYL